jgi:hypothetical protein
MNRYTTFKNYLIVPLKATTFENFHLHRIYESKCYPLPPIVFYKGRLEITS